MEYLELHPVNPQIRFLNKAVEVLKQGGVIVYPTDTVYGFGCDIFNQAAIKRIHQIKNDDGKKLYSFICPDLKNISKYAKVSDYAYKAMKKLLPGPYTFVLPASKLVPKKLWTKRKTVGIRIPSHNIAQTLAKELGNPIVSTSVKIDDKNILSDPEEIRSEFESQVDLVLANGKLIAEPSSIIDLSGPEPIILREGSGNLSYFY